MMNYLVKFYDNMQKTINYLNNPNINNDQKQLIKYSFKKILKHFNIIITKHGYDKQKEKKFRFNKN